MSTSPEATSNAAITEIETLIRARYPIIYVVSWEETRIEEEIAQVCQKRDKKCLTWSVTRGVTLQSSNPQSRQGNDEKTRDPLAALSYVTDMVDPAVFLFKDFHPYLKDPTVVRKLRETAQSLKNSYKTLILVAPTLQLPVELEKDISVVDFGLPTKADIAELLDRTVMDVNQSANLSLSLTESSREAIINAAVGLTLQEAENVFAKTLVKTGGLSDEHIPEILTEKEQIIRKSGMLEYYHTVEAFDGIGGLANLKDWLRKRKTAFSAEAEGFGLPAPKGVMLLGVQGCGKSLAAKALAALWKAPLLRFDLGRVFGSLVGSSEENIRSAIQVAESVAPAILWLDEIEKGLAGAQSSGSLDAGTTSRVFGTFITWLQEKTAPVFVVATANNISQLPPELLRKGRFDEIFFVDLPGRSEREDIFRIHLGKRKRNPDSFDIPALAAEAEGFSGAEIEQAIVSALFDAFDQKRDLTTEDVLAGIRQTVPLSRTMSEEIENLRKWASERARPASSGPVQTTVGGRKLEL